MGWLYKTPVSNSLDNSPPSLLAGRRTEPLSDSMQMTTIDNQIFFSHALTSYGFKTALPKLNVDLNSFKYISVEALRSICLALFPVSQALICFCLTLKVRWCPGRFEDISSGHICRTFPNPPVDHLPSINVDCIIFAI